ncbi:MAG: D-glucuronyl C5-epimerase family protein [Pseudomonadales bacterium]
MAPGVFNAATPTQRFDQKPPERELPVQTPMSGHGVSADGVMVAYLPSGAEAFNVFEVAMQAMQGQDAFSVYATRENFQGRLPRLAISSGTPIEDPFRLAALDWLEKNAVPIGRKGLIWHYQFDNAYNDVFVPAPWGSAFGQAYVARAFLTAFEDTQDKRYRRFALAALVPFGIPIAQGGFQSDLSGSPFFEEVPIDAGAHILNGHMISTIALIEVGRKLKVKQYEQLGLKGAETLKRNLWKYDLGYWSRYDLNPKKFEIPIRIQPLDELSAEGFQLDSISIVNPRTGKAVALDVGSSDDAVGAWRIAGSDWNIPQMVDGRTVRSFRFGPCERSDPVEGGTIQNTYLYLELPEWQLLRNYDGTEEWQLHLVFFDAAASQVLVQTRSVNEGNYHRFITLGGGHIETGGTETWKEARVALPSKALSWFMGSDYQRYHISLLERLAELTGDEVFSVFSQRWSSYLEQFDPSDPEKVVWKDQQADCGNDRQRAGL